MLKSPHDLVAAARAQVQEISLEQARSLLAGTTAIIDVREPDEYAAGHLPGATNIPRGMLEFAIARQPGCDRADAPILLYCKTSGRAALAACALQSLGYGAVRSLAGGFDAWAAAGLPVHQPSLPSFD